jgi:triacylglycerol lipase
VLDTLSPARRRFTLVLLLAALLVAIAVAAAVVVRWVGGRGEAAAQDRQGPVLLVTGYGGDVGALAPLRDALEADGRDVLVVPPVAAGTGDLRDQARAVDLVADRALRRSAVGSVDVVGYSAGGVVARLWVRDLGGDEVARRLVSLGSPQHGTRVAAVAAELAGDCPLACRQLAPGSDLLRRLNARDETPRGPRFVSVWSTADEVVVPSDSARLVGGLGFTVQSVCPARRTAHGQLPSDPVVLAALRRALGVEPPAPPRAPADVHC